MKTGRAFCIPVDVDTGRVNGWLLAEGISLEYQQESQRHQIPALNNHLDDNVDRIEKTLDKRGPARLLLSVLFLNWSVGTKIGMLG